ncbi:hypothetical protein KMW28_17585 [Flammeovirga yaeyamensis]|uniref:Uncharacterized protein n=1 Tax=Flammeovirga yaeyamensis TaxID=367791 RepID=A0AAX1N1V1_9BACT|nr:hypothetical protein [Flammeovirga yaeyamensis]MBB3698166.1 hypothetical protein [Flammeovirga yaeyamensis]NMF34477.1 hypothetical protein [Flammeovirga yaeyamensis]QWG01456.1 hypothetical protein KMW28_17585 [Flammeovirga yaeyamensis]
MNSLIKISILFFTFLSSLTTTILAQDLMEVQYNYRDIRAIEKRHEIQTIENKTTKIRVVLEKENKNLLVSLITIDKKTNKLTTNRLSGYYHLKTAHYIEGNLKYNFEKVIEDYQGNFWVLSSVYSPKSQKLYRRSFDTNTGKLGTNILMCEREIHDYAGRAVKYKGTYFSNVNYHFVQSKNKQFFSIVTYFSNAKLKNTKMMIDIIDKNFDNYWSTTTTLNTFNDQAYYQNHDPYKSPFEFKDILITGNGIIFAMHKVYNSDKRKDKFYILKAFKKGEKEPITHYIRHDEKNIHDLSITINNSNNVLVSGFYNTKKKYKSEKIEGLYFLNINSDEMSMITESYTPFNRDQLKSFWIPSVHPFGDQKKFKSIVKNATYNFDHNEDFVLDNYYYTLKLIPHENNSFSLVSETIIPPLVAENLQIININEFGKINWIKCFRKKNITKKEARLEKLAYSSTISSLYHKPHSSVFEILDHVVMIYREDKKVILGIVNSNGETQFDLIYDNEIKNDLSKYRIYPGEITLASYNSLMGIAFYNQKEVKDEKVKILDYKFNLKNPQ